MTISHLLGQISDKYSDYEIEEIHVSNDDNDNHDAVTEISFNQRRQSNASNWQLTGSPKQ